MYCSYLTHFLLIYLISQSTSGIFCKCQWLKDFTSIITAWYGLLNDHHKSPETWMEITQNVSVVETIHAKIRPSVNWTGIEVIVSTRRYEWKKIWSLILNGERVQFKLNQIPWSYTNLSKRTYFEKRYRRFTASLRQLRSYESIFTVMLIYAAVVWGKKNNKREFYRR